MPFKYDHNGIRSQKTVTENGVTTTTDYIYHGKLLAAMTRGSDVLRFEYDAQSRPSVVMYNGTRYVYLHNIQSDIVGIMDTNGNLVVEYRYDAWGKPLSITGSMASMLGIVNPLRYRGYVYDEETGLYYLKARFYNASICRFINEDTLLSDGKRILSHNVFAYCSNAPIRNHDPEGQSILDSISNMKDRFLKDVRDSILRIRIYKSKPLDRIRSLASLYDCLGNASGKESDLLLPGYVIGMGVEETAQLFEKLVGERYIRRIGSMDAEVADDEYIVVLRCGKDDYHFMVIVEDSHGETRIYNKQGPYPMQICEESCVTQGVWVQHNHNTEPPSVYEPTKIYDSAWVYFAVKER